MSKISKLEYPIIVYIYPNHTKRNFKTLKTSKVALGNHNVNKHINKIIKSAKIKNNQNGTESYDSKHSFECNIKY